jgi:hypothetical protein
MDIETARKIVSAHNQKILSEIAKAVNVLYQEFGTYQSITREMGRSDKFWIVRHRISQLPVGILWQINVDTMPKMGRSQLSIGASGYRR